jgi:hypothetical protein
LTFSPELQGQLKPKFVKIIHRLRELENCSYEGQHPSSRGYNSKRVKIHKTLKKTPLQNRQPNFNEI